MVSRSYSTIMKELSVWIYNLMLRNRYLTVINNNQAIKFFDLLTVMDFKWEFIYEKEDSGKENILRFLSHYQGTDLCALKKIALCMYMNEKSAK